MTLEELLKAEDENAQLSVGNSWLVWSFGEWQVCCSRYGAHNTCLYAGDSLDAAIAALIGEVKS